MRIKQPLYCIFFILLQVISVKVAKAQTYPFTNYTTETGLSQGQILCMFQDDDGVMWFGTNGGGITKYDGNTYDYLKESDGLADNVVFCIVKDKNGMLLIGTNNGLSVYNPKTRTFKNYTTKNGLSHNRIFAITMTHDGKRLLGTGQGISLFNDTICSVWNIDEALNAASVFHLSEDHYDHVWISTLGHGIFQYDGQKVKNYTSKEGLGNDMVFSSIEVSPDTYWILTGSGLYELHQKKIRSINPANFKDDITYYSAFKDRSNVLWIACSAGILKIRNEAVTVFNEKNGLVDNSMWHIFQDKESNLWFASNENGVSKLNSERFFQLTTKDGLLYDEVKKVYQGKDGHYLIGSLMGLTIYDGTTFRHYTTDDFNKGNANIWSIAEDSHGNYLIGTGNGLLVYNGQSFRRIISRDKESQINIIYEVYVDSKGETWLGTQAGVAKIVDGHIEPASHIFIPKNFVYKIYEDSLHHFWFGTDAGLYKYDQLTLKHFTEKEGFTQKAVRNIIPDKKGNLWFATGAGIYQYSKSGVVTSIKEPQGLSSNDVNSLIIDRNGILWAGLTNGLDKIERRDGGFKVTHYTPDDGFTGQECILNSMLIDQEGRLLIGTTKGLMFYQSAYDTDNKHEPITRIKRLDLFNQKTDWHEHADSVDYQNIPQHLELPYDKNYLTFNFIGVSLTTPGKVNYKYMLKGIDKTWKLSKKTEAVYSNIPPGSYEFLVMAENGEGVWNKEPVSFQFVIRPPFWRTWWFYSLVVLIILSGIYSYVKIRAANTKILKQNEIIEEKNSALQHANQEIASKNKSITDSINYAKRIQESFLTSEKIFTQIVKDHFIFYKPRDIVSGDFYWAFDLPDRTLIACADCTGHGIPGAFMSLIGISLLNEIANSKGMIEPENILNELRRQIILALNPDQTAMGRKDGMDISFISLFKTTEESDTVKIHFAGANHTLYILPENTKDTLLEFKGDKQPVGFYARMKPFTQQEVIARKGDTIYLYTDGYADQFGGPEGKKFMSRQLKQYLVSIGHLPMKEQAISLRDTLSRWQGDLEQVDDVTVMGIRLS